MEQLELKEPVFILSKKDYATGEVTFEGVIVDNSKLNLQLILTFKDPQDADKYFLKLSQKYKIYFIPV